MKEQRLEFDVEFDIYFNGILIVACPHCGRRQKKKFRSLQPGSNVTCSCGGTIHIDKDDFSAMQKSLAEVKRAMSA